MINRLALAALVLTVWTLSLSGPNQQDPVAVVLLYFLIMYIVDFFSSENNR